VDDGRQKIFDHRRRENVDPREIAFGNLMNIILQEIQAHPFYAREELHLARLVWVPNPQGQI
jgi:hypothetical protein